MNKVTLNSTTWQASVVFEKGQKNVDGLIRYFEKNTDFTLKEISSLGQVEPDSSQGANILVISSDGEECELASHIVEGKYTIIEFSADWCIPCKELEQKLVTYMKSREHIALRKINIVNWESPVTKQHLANEKSIPFVIVFSPTGEEIFRGSGDFEKIVEVVP